MSPNVLTSPPVMTPAQTAKMVKEARLRKPMTQKELAELAGISLRSLQRIENGVVLPRAHTWRQLGTYVNLEEKQYRGSAVPECSANISKLNLPRKLIISAGALLVITLSFSAFVIQSPTFPETLFETVNMILAGCVIYIFVLYKIWK